MPHSAKQLDDRYKNACRKIEDARDYTLQHLKTTININLQDFFGRLCDRDLKECHEELQVVNEAIMQCTTAVKNEESRRELAQQIKDKADRDQKKKNREGHI